MAPSSSEHVVNPEIAQVANAYGIATEYWDQAGQHHQVNAETITAVLAVFGVDASTPELAAAALNDHRLAHWRRMLPPVFITRQHAEAITWVHVPHGEPVRVWIELEDGGHRHDVVQIENWTPPQWVDGMQVGEASFRLPSDLPLGWHTLHAESSTTRDSSPMAVAPHRLELPASLQQRAAWGLAVQLYSLRSSRSWGLGDFGDLGDLAAWSGNELGCDFIQINPVHAGEPEAPMTQSPYLPVTRRFVNPVYIRVEDVPEYAYLPVESIAAIRQLGAVVQQSNTTYDEIDRDASWAAKKQALEMVWRFPRSPGREADYRGFVDEQGVGLRDFATWCVISELYGQDFNQWPTPLQDPANEAVAKVREEHEDRVDFYRWLQWTADEQLGAAQRSAREGGMRVGILHDLAVGVHTKGADAWGLQGVLARGVSVGAPPDMFNQQGQDWTQPPWRPDKLAEAAFLPFRDMVRTVLRHAGALRIDHILGLFRLWWIPEGLPPSAGTFVKYDHEALINILVLEAHRANAVIIGEDLGTVEDWVQHILSDHGILGTTVLWFERHGDHIVPAEEWRWASMSSVTIHDLPPTAGYLKGEHVRIRSELGLMVDSEDEAWAEQAAEQEAWREHLTERGLLRPDGDDEELIVALHRLVGQSPSRLISIALPDAVGDTRPQNQPGTDREYPNWVIPLADGDGTPVSLEDLVQSPLLRRLVAAVGG